MNAKRGFTLVEILIVVVILGIIAAIVVPHFKGVGSEARLSSLCGNLQRVRSQIELYKFNHNDQLPGVGGATFEQAMTGYTDGNGDVAAAPGPGVYGPYLLSIPRNACNDLDTARVDGDAAGANTHGWRYSTATGEFQADDSNAHASL